MVWAPGRIVANIAVNIRVNTMAEWMVARVTMKAFLQVPPTETTGRTRTRSVRAIARKSIHSRHPPARDGRLERVTLANEVEEQSWFSNKKTAQRRPSEVNRWIAYAALAAMQTA